jgi:phosphoglycerate kinase
MSYSYLRMADLNLENKRVLIRVDLNVPMQAGKISNDARIKAILPTVKLALEKKAAVILLSHLGRPEEGHYQPEFSLRPIAEELSRLLQCPIRFQSNWLNGVSVNTGEVVLCENVRFNVGEKANDPNLSKKMAALCDVFVMDAFGTAHRAEASTEGVARFASQAAAGPLLTQELETITKIFNSPKRPLVAIVGGAKVSSKIQILKSLLATVDTLIVGGGIANTFLTALAYPIGSSLYEPDCVSMARELLEYAKKYHKLLLLPEDVVVAKEMSSHAKTDIKKISNVAADDKIFDIGPETSQRYADIIQNAATLLWNGPVGVFEYENFSEGTRALAKAIARSPAFSVAGGGETLAAINKFGVQGQLSYVSTGGGAFLECLEGHTLPAVKILEQRFQTQQGEKSGT